MHTRLIKIGNSQGIRIPRYIVDELALDDDLELRVESGALVIRPLSGLRKGWAEDARKISLSGEENFDDFDILAAETEELDS